MVQMYEEKIRHPICLCEELEEEIRFEGMEEGTMR